jgi:hypothetical protein
MDVSKDEVEMSEAYSASAGPEERDFVGKQREGN